MIDLSTMLRSRTPRWSLASQLRFLGCKWAHVQVLGEPKVARWCSLGEALALQSTLDELARPVYLTLNWSGPAGRRSPTAFGSGNWNRNSDIKHYTVLPFDCDPVRKNGIKESPSSAEEFELAARAAMRTMEWLLAAGVPKAAIGLLCSGNGFWVLVRCMLPATAHGSAAVHGLLARWKQALEPEWHGDVSLDAGNFDPRRVGPFLGLLKRKGEETDERPYRKSYWITGCGSVVLPATDVHELLRRVGGEPAATHDPGDREYCIGLTERTLNGIGWQRVYAALDQSPQHCLWCGHRASGASSTVTMLGSRQSCLRGTCRSMGRNQRSLARVVAKKLTGEDDWYAHEEHIRRWINTQFAKDLPIYSEIFDDAIL